MFDCIDAFLPSETQRVKIEEAFGREIRNIIACEGLERTERHVGFDEWCKLMTGFRNVEINEREFVQSQLIVKMYDHHPYGRSLLKVKKNGGGITLSWSEQPLYTVSAWTPGDVAGSSSALM